MKTFLFVIGRYIRKRHQRRSTVLDSVDMEVYWFIHNGCKLHAASVLAQCFPCDLSGVKLIAGDQTSGAWEEALPSDQLFGDIFQDSLYFYPRFSKSKRRDERLVSEQKTIIVDCLRLEEKNKFFGGGRRGEDSKSRILLRSHQRRKELERVSETKQQRGTGSQMEPIVSRGGLSSAR